MISGKWECENGIVVELADNVLTISGKGILDTVVKDVINKTICVSNKYKVECVIGSGITNIEDMAFENCRGLGSVKIPDSVTWIDVGVFRNCSSLSSIEIPNSITSIGNGVFYDCSNLSNIEIPNSVTSIGNSVFYGCKNLKRFTNHSFVDYFLNCSIHGYEDNGQWYLENTDIIIDKIANGQTAVYKKIGEDGKPIEDVKYGDINSDGDINVQDGVLLKKHLAGIRGLNIDITASDVNVDGEVNIQDAVLLIKHLAGMNVTMGKK